MVLPKTFNWPEHRLTITIVPDWDLPMFIFSPTWKIPLPVPPCLWTKKAILKQSTCCATGDYMQFKSLNVFCDCSMSIVFGLLFLLLRIAASTPAGSVYSAAILLIFLYALVRVYLRILELCDCALFLAAGYCWPE